MQQRGDGPSPTYECQVILDATGKTACLCSYNNDDDK